MNINEIKEALEKGYDRDSNIMLHYQSKIRSKAFEWLQGLVEEYERLEKELKLKEAELKAVDNLGVKYQKQNAELAEALRKAKEFYEGITSFYGQELQVYNWHMNGEPEPFDNFIDDNMPDGLEESFKVLRKYGLEGKEDILAMEPWALFECESCQTEFAIKEKDEKIDEPICPVCTSDNVRDAE